MKYFLTILCVVFGFITSAQLKVMTYNIRNSKASDGVNKWDLRKDSLFSLIAQANPDILGTQEVLRDQLRDFQKQFKSYTHVGVGRNNGKRKGEHSTIFFKPDKFEQITQGNFWLSEFPNQAGTKSWDAAITRICTWVKLKDKSTNKVLFVFNTHLDHKGELARQNSALLIRDIIDSLTNNEPVLLIGDFNCKPYSKTYINVVDSNFLIDSYESNEPNYSACGFEIANKICSRIDYIFHSPHLQKQDYMLYTNHNGKYYPSDHLPIVATFTY